MFELKRQRNVAAVILEQSPGDGRRPPPGREKSLITIQNKQDDRACIESRKRLEKTDHPARPSLCARQDDNDISFMLQCLFYRDDYSLRRGAALITIESTRG